MEQVDPHALVALGILDIIEDGAFVFSPESLIFSYVNEGAVRQTGYSRQELLSMTPLDLKLEFGEAPFRQMLEPLLSGEVRVLRFAASHRRKSGEDISVDVILQYLASANAEPKLVAIVRDISDRRETELALKREMSEWTQAMDSFEDVIYLLDTQRRLVRANKMFYALARTSPAEAIGRHITEIIHPLGELVPCPVCQAQEEKRDAVITMEADHPDNPAGRPLEITVKIIRDEAGMASGILMAIHDLSHARKIEAKLRENKETLKRAQAIAHVGSWKLDIPTQTVNWSDETYRIFGLPIGSPIRHDTRFSMALSEDREFVANDWNQVLAGSSYDIEYRIQTSHGIRWVRDRAEVVFDGEGKALALIGTVQYITENKEKEAQIEFLAFHDPLTRLPNRLLAKDHLEMAAAYASRTHTRVALLFLDLDNFKTINDSLGHAVGDALLKAVAARLRDSVRSTDTISRQGGDEFLMLLPDASDTEAITDIAQKVLRTLNAPFDIDGHQLATSASIGIAVYPDDGSDFDTLLKKADTAMYQAKKAGRSTYRFYTEQMNVDAVERHQMLTGLARALERKEFVLYYQPQIDIASGAVVGAEALIRWQHPERGLVPPGLFIPVAEDSGHIVPIGEWVLQEACRQAAAWQQAGLPELIMAVNLSAVQFKRSNLETSVTQALADSGLRPELLELELTESILIQDTENMLGTVHRLKALGVKLSIDDFGTGYSSLSYLSRFAVDKLKIDQSFVRDMVDNPGNAAIVRAIIQMAKSLNLKTIAEGVEDESLLAPLRLHHCDEAQGYYFARPMPADEFALYLAKKQV
ncbi:MAG: EAL domain-containing protein [Sulfurimicrobium sp.]|nr:EAL domain-containing protein [Sulfurimicrobium sp.]